MISTFDDSGSCSFGKKLVNLIQRIIFHKEFMDRIMKEKNQIILITLSFFMKIQIKEMFNISDYY